MTKRENQTDWSTKLVLISRKLVRNGEVVMLQRCVENSSTSRVINSTKTNTITVDKVLRESY